MDREGVDPLPEDREGEVLPRLGDSKDGLDGRDGLVEGREEGWAAGGL